MRLCLPAEREAGLTRPGGAASRGKPTVQPMATQKQKRRIAGPTGTGCDAPFARRHANACRLRLEQVDLEKIAFGRGLLLAYFRDCFTPSMEAKMLQSQTMML